MRIVGANGIATHGEGNIDILLRRLELLGHETVDVKLPKRYWFSARWGGCRDGTLIAQASKDGDIIVGHSYGCVRAWHAHQVRDYKAIICIAPAMSHKAEWKHPERVHCFYSASDWAVRFGSWLLFHPFGRAGTHGFKQPGVINNVETSDHDDYFRGEWLNDLERYIHGLAK